MWTPTAAVLSLTSPHESTSYHQNTTNRLPTTSSSLAADAFGIRAVYILRGVLLLTAGTIGLTGYKVTQARWNGENRH